MKNISDETIKDLFYDKEELDKKILEELGYKKGHDEGYEEGITDGIAEGHNEEKLLTLKNMLDEKEKKEKIMKYLNLSSEEYEKYLSLVKK